MLCDGRLLCVPLIACIPVFFYPCFQAPLRSLNIHLTTLAGDLVDHTSIVITCLYNQQIVPMSIDLSCKGIRGLERDYAISTDCNVDDLNRSRCNGNWSFAQINKNINTPLPVSCEYWYLRLAQARLSLVPRPFEGRRKDLVHTVCACAKFTEIFLV